MDTETLNKINNLLSDLADRLQALKDGLRQIIGIIPGWPMPWQTDPGAGLSDPWPERDSFVDYMTLEDVNAYGAALATYAQNVPPPHQ